MSSPTPLAASPAPSDAEAMHGCVRCGARIPIHESMCEACNPLGLQAPAASQAHGIAFVGIAVAVVIMAVVAKVLIAGMGPFTSSVQGITTDPGGLRVTVSVTNTGSAAGATTCRIDDPSTGGIGPGAAYVESPRVGGGETVSFEVVVGGFGKEPRELIADCGS